MCIPKPPKPQVPAAPAVDMTSLPAATNLSLANSNGGAVRGAAGLGRLALRIGGGGSSASGSSSVASSASPAPVAPAAPSSNVSPDALASLRLGGGLGIF